jgi:hypothetical protein
VSLCSDSARLEPRIKPLLGCTVKLENGAVIVFSTDTEELSIEGLVSSSTEWNATVSPRDIPDVVLNYKGIADDFQSCAPTTSKLLSGSSTVFVTYHGQRVSIDLTKGKVARRAVTGGLFPEWWPIDCNWSFDERLFTCNILW